MAEYKYTPADFKSDQEVRWCPGCGDHAILSAVQRALPEIADATDTPHNLFTFVSGIGCSSRFIYYMKTYGFHSVHGRANAVATGVKVANPRLSVWVTTGDGDSLAIGGNHFIHAIRRNVDLNVILFNNEIYGLTKGQYSPTSKLGKITKTSPYGTVEKPFNPGELVIGAKGTFFARSVDMEVQLSKECMVAAAMHKGMSVIEVLQNCVIFNDKTHAAFAADKATRAERTITLRHGGKMLFGANMEKGIVFEDMKLKVVTVGQDGYTLDDVLTHDAHERDTTLHSMLAAMKYPDYPVALGVIRAVEDAIVRFHATLLENDEVRLRLERLATTDGLTGLFNRHHFMALAADEMARAARYGRPITVGIADLDHFKQVNDTLGHAAGDHVLKTFAALLGDTLRQTDRVCRYGGEEFAFVFPETTPDEAQLLGERLRTRLLESPPVLPDGRHLAVTFSLGLADASGCGLEESLARADLGLYEAKRAGRNRTVVTRRPDGL